MFKFTRSRLKVSRRSLSTSLAVIALMILALPGIAGALTPGEEHRGTSFTLGEINDDIGASALHRRGVTGAGVTVAVIDTGVNPVPGLDGTGKLLRGPDLSFEAGVEELHGRDTYGHGTVMASIIAGNDGVDGGFVGVAPDARILSMKVADNTGAVDVTQVIAALDWIVEYGHEPGLDVGVINLSYRVDNDLDPADDPLIAAVERAWDAGFVVVVSAGNDGDKVKRLGSPARSPYVIAVAASGEADKGLGLSEFSNTGSKDRHPDITAPGERILGLGALDSRLAQENPGAIVGDRFLRGSGTSQAAAVVSGAAALMLQADPALTPDDVKLALMLGADDRKDRSVAALMKIKKLEDAIKDIDKAREKVEKKAEKVAQLEAKRDKDIAEIEAKHRGRKADQEVRKAEKEWAGEIAKEQQKVDKEQSELDKERGSFRNELKGVGKDWTGRKIDQLKLDKRSGAGWLDVERSMAIGAAGEPQAHVRAVGDGSLDAARGGSFVTMPDGSLLQGDVTFTGSTWSGSTWSGSTWSGSTWSGSSWSGSTWSGSSWSGSSWSGSSWSGSSWSGSSWSGSSWSGSSWSGATWAGITWD